MKIRNDVHQGELAWLRVRMGRVCASEMGNLLTPKLAIKTGEGPHTYLCKKLVEVWRGEPTPTQGTWQMEAGNIVEDEARPWFELQHSVDVEQVGFCESDDGKSGCSPDGLIEAFANLDGPGGLEIKCPEAHTHVKYLLGGVLPDEYVAQVHASMFVTGRKWWKFLSYRRHFPAFQITVHRDEKIMKTVGEAIAAYSEKFNNALDRMKAGAIGE